MVLQDEMEAAHLNNRVRKDQKNEYNEYHQIMDFGTILYLIYAKLVSKT